MRRRPFRRSTGEPTIALINVVFLMLVFFLVAGTLSRPLPADLQLVRTDELDPAAPPDALVLHADGRLTWRGAAATPEDYAQASSETARLLPDRKASALQVLETAAGLEAAGAHRVTIVTARGVAE